MSDIGNPIPRLSDETEVRDLVEGLTQVEYPADKVYKSLRYGDTEVCDYTSKKTWNITDPQWHKAIQAANLFAASNLIPKTIATQEGNPVYMQYKRNAIDICTSINTLMISPTQTDTAVITSTKDRNYYTNKNALPFMGQEGYGGSYNTNNPEYYSVDHP